MRGPGSPAGEMCWKMRTGVGEVEIKTCKQRDGEGVGGGLGGVCSRELDVSPSP